MLTLPTYVIGPRNPDGRDFSFLAEALPVASLAPSAQSVAGALPLALSAWSRHGEPGCVAAVPLGDGDAPVLLMRVAMLGFTDIGRLVFAHAVLADAATLAALDFGSEKLLDVIPVPDGNALFGQTPLTIDVDVLSSGTVEPWPGLGLGWQDRCILVESAADAEAALRSALASIDPPEQRQRVRGWASSGGFTRVGGFDPGAAFQALAIAEGSHPLPAAMLPYRAARSGFAGDPAMVPASYLRWQELTGLFGYKSTGAARSADLPVWLRWRFADSVAGGDAVIERVLRGAAAALAGPDIVRLLAVLVTSGNDGLADPARALFWQLIDRQADDAAAAYYPAALAADHADAVAPMLGSGWLAARLSPLDHLGEEALSMMLAHGLLPALARHEAVAGWVADAPIGQVVRLGAALAQDEGVNIAHRGRLLAEVSARLSCAIVADGETAAPVGPVFGAVIDMAASGLAERDWRSVERARLIDATAAVRPDALTRLSRNWLALGGPDGNHGDARCGTIALWLRLAQTARTARA